MGTRQRPGYPYNPLRQEPRGHTHNSVDSKDCYSCAVETELFTEAYAEGVAAERERCAKRAEEFFDKSDDPPDISASACGSMIASAIREVK